MKGVYIFSILAMLASSTHCKETCKTFATYLTYCRDGYQCCNDDKECCLPSNNQNQNIVNSEININVESENRAGPIVGISLGSVALVSICGVGVVVYVVCIRPRK